MDAAPAGGQVSYKPFGKTPHTSTGLMTAETVVDYIAGVTGGQDATDIRVTEYTITKSSRTVSADSLRRAAELRRNLT